MIKIQKLDGMGNYSYQIKLSGDLETIPGMPDPHRFFLGPMMTQAMPRLVTGKNENEEVIDFPRNPASLAYILKRRMKAPKEVRKGWQENYFFTGDASVAGTNGDHLIVLDAKALRNLTLQSEIYKGALVLSQENWDELKGQDNVVYFNAHEVQEANGRGYVKKEGVWVPANRSVGKFVDTLSRGQDLSDYIRTVSESEDYQKIRRYQNIKESKDLFVIYTNTTLSKNSKPTMRAWSFDAFSYGSFAKSTHSYDCHPHLVGIVKNEAKYYDMREQFKQNQRKLLNSFNNKYPRMIQFRIET